MDSAVITVRGNDITVDWTGVTLEGMAPDADPDAARGLAVRVDGGRNIRLVNARIRGYKVGILAQGTSQLHISGSDLSWNWKPRLFSLIEHESLRDWLSFHNNENGEWLRYGAAIYLDGVTGGSIQGNTVTQGMNALLLNRTNGVMIRDNDFSFNSGLGLGLYRSSRNTIISNSMNFNIRGYSHGFYHRGQDSSGMLFYQQSNHNIVAFNSATHGGDGLFLWAGNHTMDTGSGGANDNVFFANDFSFAAANGMEATFSRNVFLANIAEGNDYGLWGGYSYQSKIVANCFGNNRVGVAIEHGQENVIAANTFAGDSTAIRLWADSIQPSDWGYPRYRDTRSHDYLIEGNRFEQNKSILQITNTSGVVQAENDTSRAGTACDQAIPPIPARWAHLIPTVPDAPSEIRRHGPALPRSRAAIIVDEWGPYDFRSPRLWPAGDSTHAIPLRLGVHGPAGTWRVVSREGIAELSASTGNMNDTIRVTPQADSRNRWELVLEYRGAETVSSRGIRSRAGTPVRFSYGVWEPDAKWDLKAWAWSDSTDPRGLPANWDRMKAQPAILDRTVPRLDYQWYRPTIRELPQSRYAMEATARVTLPPGEFTLRTLSDDGIRVWVDGQLVIDNWSLHGTAVDHASLSGGAHDLMIRYFQIDGWAELRLDILRGRVRSSGSPP